MNINKRIDELNTNLVLQETKIFLIIDELKHYSILNDLDSNVKFLKLIKELEQYKNDFNCINYQLNTFAAYQTRN